MVDLVELQALAYVAQIVGVAGTLTAAFIAVRSYINSNKRSEEAKKKEQETRDRELETRQAQLLMSIFQTYSSKEFQTDMEEMVHTWKWKDYDDYMSKYGMGNVKENGKHATVFKIYDGTGVFVKRGLVDPELVYDLMREAVITTWEKFLPIVENWRTKYTAPQIYQDFEFLYNEMKSVRERRGHSASKFGRIAP